MADSVEWTLQSMQASPAAYDENQPQSWNQPQGWKSEQWPDDEVTAEHANENSGFLFALGSSPKPKAKAGSSNDPVPKSPQPAATAGDSPRQALSEVVSPPVWETSSEAGGTGSVGTGAPDKEINDPTGAVDTEPARAEEDDPLGLSATFGNEPRVKKQAERQVGKSPVGTGAEKKEDDPLEIKVSVGTGPKAEEVDQDPLGLSKLFSEVEPPPKKRQETSAGSSSDQVALVASTIASVNRATKPDGLTEGSQNRLRTALIAAQYDVVREAKQAGQGDVAAKAAAIHKELKAQAKAAKRAPAKAPARLRIDLAAGHPEQLCKDKEKSRKRAAFCQMRFAGRAKRAAQRQKKEDQWHEVHDKPGTGKIRGEPTSASQWRNGRSANDTH